MACANDVMVPRIQWKPFLLAASLCSQNDWTGCQNGVKYTIIPERLGIFPRAMSSPEDMIRVHTDCMKLQLSKFDLLNSAISIDTRQKQLFWPWSA